MTTRTFLLAGGLLCGAAVVISCGPSPNPSPPPTTTTPTLAPSPTPAPCYAPVEGELGYYEGVETLPLAVDHIAAVLSAREKIGRYSCWPGHEDVPLELLATELRSLGFCAIRNDDRVFVGRTDGLYEEWHAIRYDTGCWASAERMYKGTLRFVPATSRFRASLAAAALRIGS